MSGVFGKKNANTTPKKQSAFKKKRPEGKRKKKVCHL